MADGHGGARPGAGRPKQEKPAPTGRPKNGEKHTPVAKLVRQGIEATVGEVRRVGVTEALMREVAIQCLGTLLHATRHGNCKAAMYLLDRVLSQPERAFADAVQEMSPDQIRDHLVAMMMARGLSRDVAEHLVDAMAEPEVEPAPLMQLPAIIEDVLTDSDGREREVDALRAEYVEDDE